MHIMYRHCGTSEFVNKDAKLVYLTEWRSEFFINQNVESIGRWYSTLGGLCWSPAFPSLPYTWNTPPFWKFIITNSRLFGFTYCWWMNQMLFNKHFNSIRNDLAKEINQICIYSFHLQSRSMQRWGGICVRVCVWAMHECCIGPLSVWQ